MRIRAFGTLVIAAILIASACGTGGFFRQYEYEEEMYLSLDGTATVYVNASISALNALRGTAFDASPNARVDREHVRQFFESSVAHVRGRVGTSRRHNRRFVHLRLDVPDVRRLHDAAPFAWSTYGFAREGDAFVYRQTVGPPAGGALDAARDAGWTGNEIVAFRLHLPSKITFHNSRLDPKRGNILVWEQPLADRLHGAPLELQARMETQSILYRTLWLFGVTLAAVAVTFGVVIWWILRRGARAAEHEGT
jgi:hypothetical protein